MNLYYRIKELANIRGITMYVLSQDTGISQSVFSRLKHDNTVKLNRKNLELLANYFCVNVDWLTTGKGEVDAPGVIKDTKIHDEALWERLQEMAIELFSKQGEKSLSGIDYSKFEEKTNIPQRRLYDIIQENNFPTYTEILSIIGSKDLKINSEWLFTGKGSMLKRQYEITNILPSYVEESSSTYNTLNTLPRVPYAASAGSLTHCLDGIQEYQCEKIPIVQSFPKYNFTIFIKGDSMEPKYESGDEVACKRIDNTHFIQWGKVHVLDTAQGIIIKRIYNDKNGIRCVSFNPAYHDFIVPKEEIYSISLVVGLLRV